MKFQITVLHDPRVHGTPGGLEVPLQRHLPPSTVVVTPSSREPFLFLPCETGSKSPHRERQTRSTSPPTRAKRGEDVEREREVSDVSSAIDDDAILMAQRYRMFIPRFPS